MIMIEREMHEKERIINEKQYSLVFKFKFIEDFDNLNVEKINIFSYVSV